MLAPGPRRRARRSTRARRSRSTVAKAPPQVDGARRASASDVDDAADALERGRLQGAPARADGRHARRGRRRARRRTRRRARSATRARRVTIIVGALRAAPNLDRRRRAPTPDADARRREGRRPRRRALVRARRLAGLGAPRCARALRGGRARGASTVRLERDGAWRARTATTLALRARRRPARRRRRRSRSCTARSARTARSRACSSCSTCPTSARACSPRRCAWTRSSSRRCWPPRACRRSAYAGVREHGWRADADAVRARLAALGLPLFVKPARLGSSVGIVEGRRRRPSSTPRSRRRSRHDGLVIVEAFSAGHRGRVLGARLRRARGLAAGRDRPAGAPTGTTTRPSTRRAAMELASRRGCGDAVVEEVRRLARETFLRVGLRRPGARRLLRRGRRACSSTSSTRCPGFTADERLPEAVGGDGRAVPRALRPPAGLRRSSATAPSAAATRSRLRLAEERDRRRSRRARRRAAAS